MSGLVLPLLISISASIDSIFCHQAEIAAQLRSVTYRAELTYVETDLLHNRADTIHCLRRVVMDRYEHQQDLFISVELNERPVQGRRRQRLLRSLSAKGMFARQIRLPFFPENRRFYLFTDTGTVTVEGQRLRAIRFRPQKPDRHLLTGTGYFLPGSWELVKLEFIPAELPPVVDSTRIVLKYDRVERFWLPVAFELKMALSLRLVRTLMQRRIEVREVYSDYRLRLNPEPFE